MSAASLLKVHNLSVTFQTHGKTIYAVRGVSFAIQKGEVFCVVGESGSGKSVSAQAILGLIPSPPGKITQGSVQFEGQELVGLSQRFL